MADRHPVVGSWTVSVEIPGVSGQSINLARLSADGGVAVVFPSPTPAAPNAGHKLEYWTTAIGGWDATGEDTVSMSFVALGADETGAPIGRHTVTATATMSPDGSAWSGPFTIAIANAEGSPAGEATGTVSATRLTK